MYCSRTVVRPGIFVLLPAATFRWAALWYDAPRCRRNVAHTEERTVVVYTV